MRKHKIKEVRYLTNSTFVLKFERKDIEFQTGQFVLVGTNGAVNRREYSVYSGESDNFIEILVREVEGGKVSAKLKKLKVGDTVDVDGSFGFFKFAPAAFKSQKFYFIATGTGISPFHSFVKTYPNLDYKLLHGVRFKEEAYEHADYANERVSLCTTGDDKGDFNGRVSAYLAKEEINVDSNYFLCGNSEMIYELFDILTGKGVPTSNIYSEVYF